ncbi:hypothetical protein LCGC14_2753870 [marine sediment metagenome]|uniref:Uncharacterized protein n=1 Tax=marine sediment metagenome TaxID=412755 RepID=A0A0F8Z175_9ZZZZ
MKKMEVSKVSGYSIRYDSGHRKFDVIDSEGQNLGSYDSQDDAEAKAKGFAKKSGKLPIRAISFSHHYGRDIVSGIITSVMGSGHSGLHVWFVSDKVDRYGSARSKMSTSNLYLETSENLKVVEQMDAIKEKIRDLEKEWAGTKELLTQPMDKHLQELGFKAGE